jgi:hypothetical protein
MSKEPLFPGQSARLTFTTEQVRAIAAVTRNEIFWSFSPDEPRSAADVAQETGKSAPSVHYHVQELVQVGLLVPGATRKRRSRTETLYVHGAKAYVSQGVTAPKEYREYSHKTFAAMTRGLANDNAALHKVIDQHPELGEYYFLSRRSVRLTRKQAEAVRKMISDFASSVENMDEAEGERLNLFVVIAPTMATCKKWSRRKQTQ